MFEKRVVRGNTHSSYVMSKEDEFLYRLNQQSPRVAGARQAVDSRVQNVASSQQTFISNTAEPDLSSNWGEKPPAGKEYKAAYTEEQLLSETDLPSHHDAVTQTEFVIEKEIPELAMPVYSGVDKETQIYPNEPPFDFDYEAEPLVQVLMTRILEESRVEVLEEEELSAMKRRQAQLTRHKEEVKARLNALEQQEREAVEKNVAGPHAETDEEERAREERTGDRHAPAPGQPGLREAAPARRAARLLRDPGVAGPLRGRRPANSPRGVHALALRAGVRERGLFLQTGAGGGA